MPGGSFSKITWDHIRKELNLLTMKGYSVVQIKQKFNRIREKHRLFSSCLSTGFGWDAETNTVHATEETWQNYLTITPPHFLASQFQTKGCEHYKLLGLIFNKSTAMGMLHYSSTQEPPNSDEENELDDEFRYSGVHVDVDLTSPDDPVVPSTGGGMSGGQTSLSKMKRKKDNKKESRSIQMGEVLMAWAEASKARTGAYNRRERGRV
ncbi:LOW QUALITY PROTEIN: Myb_DNA-bind_3 domain-containing protein [Cephalotus follicularis]|uniref:Myb_DNA-bind_3 domain-containing protein n=1 Tax=Cephalotus follicularis TaxID=3775 RepID=A0A1Q3CT87_CEPFO|nr:LOW QUALITY PROTEIN: Myb_DNA-bind_3 domain-containing protein [Cephalotus follicularis]